MLSAMMSASDSSSQLSCPVTEEICWINSMKVSENSQQSTVHCFCLWHTVYGLSVGFFVIFIVLGRIWHAMTRYMLHCLDEICLGIVKLSGCSLHWQVLLTVRQLSFPVLEERFVEWGPWKCLKMQQGKPQISVFVGWWSHWWTV